MVLTCFRFDGLGYAGFLYVKHESERKTVGKNCDPEDLMILCKAIMLPVEISYFYSFLKREKGKRSGRTTVQPLLNGCRNLPRCKTGGFTLDALEALGAMKHLLILSFLHIKPLSANPSPPAQ